MQTSLYMVIITIILSALIIFAERSFPFVLFSKKNPPAIIRFIEKYIPPMVMGTLVIYSLKDLESTKGAADFVPALAGVAVTIILHVIKRNSLISIIGGTVLYMFLIRIM